MSIIEQISSWQPGIIFGRWFLNLTYGWQLFAALGLVGAAYIVFQASRYGTVLLYMWVCTLIYGNDVEFYFADGRRVY